MGIKEKYLLKEGEPWLSYQKLSGKKIKDIIGHVSCEFGDPMFQICWVVFEDETTQSVGGEHDCPFMEDDDKKTYEIMGKIAEEEDLYGEE